MTGQALRRGDISEETITDALVLSRGDLFLTAGHLGCTAREVDSYIRASEYLQVVVGAIGKVKADPDYNANSTEQFRDRLELLTRNYKLEALDVVHDLATMPFETAAMAEVKLKAAIALMGKGNEVQNHSEHNNILAELHRDYQASAPRIKAIRIAQVEFEQ